MSDWYIKLLTEHPLISYIEDPFADVKGYQVFTEKLKSANLGRQIHVGIKSFYKENVEKLKVLTDFMEKDDKNKDDEGEGDENQEEEKVEVPPAEPEVNPNIHKIVVNTVHFSRKAYNYFSEITDLQIYGNSMKPERKFGLILDDSQYDSNQTHIVDMAIGMGIKFLHLKGIFEDKKIAKVERYIEVVKKLHELIPKPESEENDGHTE